MARSFIKDPDILLLNEKQLAWIVRENAGFPRKINEKYIHIFYFIT
nr:hypothetical protein [Bacillus rugosus]